MTVTERIEHDMKTGQMEVSKAVEEIRNLLSVAEHMAERGYKDVAMTIGPNTSWTLRLSGTRDTSPVADPNPSS